MSRETLKKYRFILNDRQNWKILYELQMYTLKKAERMGIRYEAIDDEDTSKKV